MDIVDEVTLMDYFTGCSELSTSNPRCDPTMSLFWLAPWLSYANFLLAAKNRTVLIDVGVAMDPANATTGHPNYPNNHWISSELDLESFFHRSYGSIKSLQGEGPTSGDPGMLPPFMKSWCTVSTAVRDSRERTFLVWAACVHTDAVFQGDTTNRTSCDHHRGPFHNFAIFTDGSYRTLAQEKPCPPGHPFCGPAASRPSRAIWWYGLPLTPLAPVGSSDSTRAGMACSAGRRPRCSTRAALRISSASARPDTCVLSPILLWHSSSYPPC